MYGNMFNSPFIIPVGAFVMVLGIVAIANLSNYHTRKLQSEERMAAMQKGIPLPAVPSDTQAAIDLMGQTMYAPDPRRRIRNTRQGGIVLVAIGIGMAIFSFLLAWILEVRPVLAIAACGVIPLAIGVGLLVDAGIQSRELDRLGSS